MEDMGYGGVTASEAAYYISHPRDIRFCRNGRTFLLTVAAWKRGAEGKTLDVYVVDEATNREARFTFGVEEKRSHKVIAMSRTIHDSY
jgi:hypothetical protein